MTGLSQGYTRIPIFARVSDLFLLIFLNTKGPATADKSEGALFSKKYTKKYKKYKQLSKIDKHQLFLAI